ncbi:hypothetical protein MMIC_P1052 [Mariprofundus micogutta]|uniref:Response regulatory domain-containing protein n=2 Tax=Mariprofundus micogutta TaxID=1921010 RepID=A0A1L8CMD9_9PROT|nr:hypothetical protein MMIC_P1052 [Mariprofundus micogutta]
MEFASPVDYLNYIDSGAYIKPTAVITDVHMPNMSGYEMMGIVLERFPDINFAVISGEPTISSRNKGLACMYLAKPFHPEAIQEMLNKFSRCKVEGASTEIGCASFGDREEFGVLDCVCPKLACMKSKH